jgi:hypothetical protein
VSLSLPSKEKFRNKGARRWLELWNKNDALGGVEGQMPPLLYVPRQHIRYLSRIAIDYTVAIVQRPVD